MQLKHIHHITADLVLETGLHIGAGDSEIHIGGIPGSSLKGKIRSLLEWKSGRVQENPLGKKEYEEASDAQQEAVKHILQLFGISGDTADPEFQKTIGHTRLAFWDCPLDPGYAAKQREDNLSWTEAKSENRINRISGTAEHPRFTERVPAGARFTFRLSLKTYDGDDDSLRHTLLQGLKLLEWDSLGGSGSRGYGKIRFENLCIDGQPVAEYAAIQPFGT